MDVDTTNLQQLIDAILSIGTKLSEECCQRLVGSMTQRMKGVLTVQGGPTQYWRGVLSNKVAGECTYFLLAISSGYETPGSVFQWGLRRLSNWTAFNVLLLNTRVIIPKTIQRPFLVSTSTHAQGPYNLMSSSPPVLAPSGLIICSRMKQISLNSKQVIQ